MADRLIIFDYSGTLSLAAVHFGQPQSLARHLEQSGLAGLGINVETYWQRMVGPTWQEASTSAGGFAPVLAQAAAALHPAGKTPGAVEKAALRFVSAYMDHSVIDPRWKPCLEKARDRPQAVVVVATDHYAEATEGIANHLGALGIPAVSARDRETTDLHRAFIVANSADMGYHKVQLPFWTNLAHRLGLSAIDRILMVDDFGASETDGSGYATAKAVIERKAKTQAAIEKGFDAPVTTLAFIADDLDRTIRDAGRIVADFLATP